jgi:hypothetical protein
MKKLKKINFSVLSLRLAFLFGLLSLIHVYSAHAQMQQLTNNKTKNPSYYNTPYWEGFKLKHADKCEEALEKLTPLAHQGYGFEDAQLATGLCKLRLAGLKASPVTKKERQDLIQDVNFKQGIEWILRAANAGHFKAQASLVSLHADNLIPPNDGTSNPQEKVNEKTHDMHVNGAMWAHLYLTNPLRLQIGAPIIEEKKLKKLENNMTKNQWLLGKELARNWFPVYIK